MPKALITFLASFLLWVMFAALFALWAIGNRIKKEQVSKALLVVLIAFILSQAIKNLFPTLRPFMLNNLPPLTFTAHSDAAFPSSHTAVAFGLATSLWPHHKKAGFLFIVAAGLVGIGRVLGNVHYFLDILAGASLGILAALALHKVNLERFFRLRG